jgi:hypothetical protein
MKHNDYYFLKVFCLMMASFMAISMTADAQSVNTKYRIKHNASNFYLGYNGNGDNSAGLVADDINDQGQIWYFLETAKADTFFLKNENGSYLGRDSGDKWWQAEVYSDQPGTGFNQWVITSVGGGSTYYIDNTSTGDGVSIGTDGTNSGDWVSVNKSGANAEWVFETVTEDFVSWDGTSWSNTTGPSATDDVLVNGSLAITSDLTINNLIVTRNGTVTVSSGTVTVDGVWDTQGSLTVASGASLITHEAGSSFGNVTVKRNSSFEDADLQYSFIGSPVSGFDIANLNAGYHYTYNTADDSYTTFTGEMTAGVGYTSAGKKSLEFTGAPNTGTKTVTLDNSGNQFNFVANPYSAAIDRSSFVTGNSNITGAIYLWDDGGSDNGQRTNADFVTVTNAGSVSGGSGSSGATFGGYIGSAQGFIVQASSAGDVTFLESMRTSGNNADASYFRNADEIAKIKLQISSPDIKDELLLAFTEGGTNAFDHNWDATKLITTDKALTIASMIFEGTEKLAIQTLPSVTQLEEETTIPLYLAFANEGDYIFDMTEFTLPLASVAILVDHSTSLSYDLTDPVTLSLGVEDNDRFSLTVLNNVLSTNALNESMRFFMDASELHLHIGNVSGLSEVAVYDLGGRIHLRREVLFSEKGEGQISLATLNSGIYLVKVIQNDRAYTLKFRYNN